MIPFIKWIIRVLVNTVLVIFAVPLFALAYLGFWAVEVIDWAFE